MRIAVLVEGKTETFFKKKLCDFLRSHLDEMPELKFIKYDGRIPKKDQLKDDVERLLSGKKPFDAVIALTDVYTGTKDFQDAADAKAKMMKWAGNNSQFYPHTAQHDFEAWLLPYWKTIQDLTKHNLSAPSGSPEAVNHQKPPSFWIKEIFRLGDHQDYNKAIHGAKILEKNDLMAAIQACPELKDFVNRIISLCDEDRVVL